MLPSPTAQEGIASCSDASPICSKRFSTCSSAASSGATPRRCWSWSRRTCASRSATSTRAWPRMRACAERLMGQVRKLDSPSRRTCAPRPRRICAPATANAAGQYALRLQTVERELDGKPQQLEQAEDTYKNLVKARDVAVTDRARQDRRRCKGAINDMRMNQAMAEMHEMAAGMITQDRRRRRHAQPPARHGRGRARARRPAARASPRTPST